MSALSSEFSAGFGTWMASGPWSGSVSVSPSLLLALFGELLVEVFGGLGRTFLCSPFWGSACPNCVGGSVPTICWSPTLTEKSSGWVDSGPLFPISTSVSSGIWGIDTSGWGSSVGWSGSMSGSSSIGLFLFVPLGQF